MRKTTELSSLETERHPKGLIMCVIVLLQTDRNGSVFTQASAAHELHHTSLHCGGFGASRLEVAPADRPEPTAKPARPTAEYWSLHPVPGHLGCLAISSHRKLSQARVHIKSNHNDLRARFL